MSNIRTPRTLFVILGYVVGVLMMAALFAPILFFGAQSVMQTSPEGIVAQVLSDKEFPDYFSRAALLAAILGLVPVLRSLGVRWREVLGNVPFSTGWKQVLLNFTLAVLFIVLMALVCGWLSAVRLKADPAWSGVLKPLLSAFSVAVIEEFLFRGAVLTILCRALGNRAGLGWTTGIFAILHFFNSPSPGTLPNDQVTWTSGFWVISQLFSGFTAWEKFVGEFLILAAVGWVLGRARLSSGGLWASIGLHAGWVAGMKYFSQVVFTTHALRDGIYSPWMVRNTCRAIVSPIVGIIPLIAVLLTGLVALWLMKTWQCHPKERANAQGCA